MLLNPTMPLPLVALLLICLLGSPVIAAERIQVFAIKSRLPQELVPLIKPLAGPGSTVSAMGDRLIVKAADAQLEQIRQLLVELDRPPRRLMIEVRRGGFADRQLGAAGVDARLGAERGSVSIGRPAHEGVQAQLRAVETTRRDDLAQRVQALEGRPAFIAAGAEVPVQQPSLQAWPGGLVVQNQSYYRDATAGFYVVPWVRGNQVTLGIRQHAHQPTAGGAFAVQRAETTVAGRLGEWLDLGGSAQTLQEQGMGIGHYARTRGRSDVNLQVRVTALD
jgi:hypothetical protein